MPLNNTTNSQAFNEYSLVNTVTISGLILVPFSHPEIDPRAIKTGSSCPQLLSTSVLNITAVFNFRKDDFFFSYSNKLLRP